MVSLQNMTIVCRDSGAAFLLILTLMDQCKLKPGQVVSLLKSEEGKLPPFPPPTMNSTCPNILSTKE